MDLNLLNFQHSIKDFFIVSTNLLICSQNYTIFWHLTTWNMNFYDSHKPIRKTLSSVISFTLLGTSFISRKKFSLNNKISIHFLQYFFFFQRKTCEIFFLIIFPRIPLIWKLKLTQNIPCVFREFDLYTKKSISLFLPS